MTVATILEDAKVLDVKLYLDPITGSMCLLPPRTDHEAVKAQIQRLAEQAKAYRVEIRHHLAPKCRQCKRPVWCQEDRDRLATINPFCREVGCPMRRRESDGD